MKRRASRKKLADFQFQFWCHPDIHPNDARNAIFTWFRRSYKDRGKAPHIILEKLLIASAMEKGVGVSEPIWKDHKGRILAVPDDGFKTRWKRARKDGRAAIFDKLDIFVLRNWRELHSWPELAKKGCPGLCEWSPCAATALLRTLPDAANASDETWYVKKRTRLGLKGKHRYRVHDFRRYKDGRSEVEID